MDSILSSITDKVHHLDSFVKSSESRIAELKYQLDTMGGTENQQAKAALEKTIEAFEKTITDMKLQLLGLPQIAQNLTVALDNPRATAEQGDETGRDTPASDNPKDKMTNKLTDAKNRADSHTTIEKGLVKL